MNVIVYNLVYDLQLYSVDHIDKITDKALKTEFKTLMALFISINKGVTAVLNRICIALNKLLIIPQLYVIKVMKES